MHIKVYEKSLKFHACWYA